MCPDESTCNHIDRSEPFFEQLVAHTSDKFCTVGALLDIVAAAGSSPLALEPGVF
jgi:hypothetical protein